MHRMYLNHLLDSLTLMSDDVPFMDTWVALSDELQLKLKAFNLPPETSMLYQLYLLRFLDFLEDSTRDQIPKIIEDFHDAQETIIHCIFEQDDRIITPLLCYIHTISPLLGVSEWLQLQELNVPQEIQNCLLTITWRPSSDRHSNMSVASLQLTSRSINSILENSKIERWPWFSRWINQRMQLMCYCLNVLRQDAIQSSNNPHE